MPKAKPLTLNGLNGSYVLSSDIRDSLSIPPNILCSEVSSWRSVKSVVDNYFKSTNKPRNFASHALDEILDALQVIKNMEADKKFHLQLKRYASKVSAFLRDTDNKEEFKEIYKRMNMQRQVQVTRENAIQQGVITGNILAENGARVLAESLQASESDQENEDEISDVENNIFDDNHGEPKEYITIVKGNSIFKLQTPSKNVPSPNKPVLQRDDIEQLDEVVDLCVDLDSKKRCPKELLELSNSLINGQKSYSALKRSNIFEYVVELIKIEKCGDFEPAANNITLNNDGDRIMANLSKKLLSEFALNASRPSPYNKDDERSIYCEVFIPMFKYFSIFTQKVAFSWSERAMSHTNSIWIIDSDCKKSGVNRKLLDGIGVLVEEDVSWLLIESSGYFKDQNYTHSVEDCIKNVKNGTDSLKYIMSKYKEASLDTMKKLKVFSIQIIQTKMTLVCYQLSTSRKWKAYECGSAEIPLVWSKRKFLLGALEMFAYLYHELLEQEKVYDEITNEALGLKSLDGQIRVTSLFKD